MYKRFKEWLERRRAVSAPVPAQTITVNDKPYTLRRMTNEDIPAALDIERAVYADTPWERVAFMSELAKTATAMYLVLVDPQTAAIVAFIGISFKRTDSHITNIAVLPDYQRQGIGRKLLELMLTLSRAMGMQTVSLEVRLDNVHAQSLYRALGFVDGRVRRNYYTREHADALYMTLQLDGQLQQALAQDWDHRVNG